MSGEVPRGDDRGSLRSWSTSMAGSRDRFAVWHDLICDQLLRVVARTEAPDTFSAEIELTTYPDFQLVKSRVSSHELRLTRRLIAQNDQAYFEAAFPLSGRVVVDQDGRQASLSRGEFAFCETTRPGRLWFDEGSRFLVVRTPLAWAESLIAGRMQRERQLAQRFPHTGGSALVADFVHGLASLGERDPVQAQALSRTVPALLGSVLAISGDRQPDRSQTQALFRVQVVNYLKSHLADPSLDADHVAKAFNISRRTLYRAFAESANDHAGGAELERSDESIRATLRRLRVNRAAQTLRSDPQIPLHVVARQCGFGTEATLYRSFFRLHGRTPGEFRAALQGAPLAPVLT